MPTTYTPLFSTVVSSPTGTVVFSSIPATYTDLVLVGNVLSTSTSASVNVQFNGDGGNNYSYVVLDGNGSAVQANKQQNTSSIQFAAWSSNLGSSTNPSPMIMHINNYSSTSMHKQVVIKSTAYGASTACIDLFAGFWNNTAAINQITVACGNFAVGSTVSLYGIASAAVVSGAKATGGDVVATDGTYWYHGFTASGTFTPTEALTADVLVVAGGGGSGGSQGSDKGSGGGGAGGVIYFASQSLSATGYSVTVGAGGAAGPSSGAMAGSNGNNSQFASLTVGLGGGGGAAGFGGGGPSSQHNGKDGGSGGGATRNGTTGLTTQSGTGATAFHGNNGGSAGAVDGGAGGGGAGAAGNSAPLVVGGSGGNGINIYSSLVLATGLGVGGFIAGGGGGGAYSGAGGTGGSGGGGTGGAGGGGQGNAGSANSGGGAGGTGGNAPAHAGNAGGSGLVIVRYAV